MVGSQNFSMDPRPVAVYEDTWHVPGVRCAVCGYVSAHQRPWCPRCSSGLDDTRFGSTGTVWSSTVVRVAVPGRTPPYVLAYVDLDGGPRVLAHVVGSPDGASTIGAAVEVCGVGADGDLEVTVA